MRRWILSGQTVSSFVYGPNSASSNGSHPFLIGPPTTGFVDWFQHMTLPALALALGLIGVYTRYIRSAMLTSLGQTYAVVARAKGLSERTVLYKHVLKNGLIPVVTILGLQLGVLLA